MNAVIKEIVGLTLELMRFRTVRCKPEELDRCARYIEAYLKKAQINYIRRDLNGKPSILVTPGEQPFPVLLLSHIDVVDGPDQLFVPRVEEGKIFGRGSIDDKYAVALSLVLLKNLMAGEKAAGRGQSALNMGILITGDEESGGHDGAKKHLQSISPQFSIILDGGSPDVVITKEKGILQFQLESVGTTAHASRPWLGENAIDGLIRDYHAIQDCFGSRFSDTWQRTINSSIVSGGREVNQVPDSARMVFDIRYTEKDDPDALLSLMRSKIKGTLTVLEKEPVFITHSTPFLDKLLLLDKAMKPGFEHGASDARHLAEYGMTGVVWGAQGNLSQHSENEHVEIRSLEILYDRLARFLRVV